MDVWHDRAVFHFLTSADDRTKYRAHLRRTLKVRGTAIVATFAPDGPARCSGLPVVRYSADTLAAELGDEFRLVEAKPYRHRTPWGAISPLFMDDLRAPRHTASSTSRSPHTPTPWLRPYQTRTP